MKDTLHTDGRSYYSLWIKPEAGLSAGTAYAGRPPGNSPELMPWDTSLNKDVDDCVARHVAVGYGLKEGDLGYSTRFSRHTLREQTSAYKRVMDPALGMEKGAPTSKRICQDIRKFILALTGIRDARGICVQGLGSRTGHRAAAANGQVQRGGKREKKVATEDPWFHSDVAETRLRLIAASRERHAKK